MTIRKGLIGAGAFLIVVHLLARLLWHLQLFGMNTREGDSTYRLSETDDFQIWIYDHNRETDFFQYTSDLAHVATTHVVGLIVVLVLGALVVWVLSSSNETHQSCTDPNCPCVTHHQFYENGKWNQTHCEDSNCPCLKHTNEVFRADFNGWIA